MYLSNTSWILPRPPGFLQAHQHASMVDIAVGRWRWQVEVAGGGGRWETFLGWLVSRVIAAT